MRQLHRWPSAHPLQELRCAISPSPAWTTVQGRALPGTGCAAAADCCWNRSTDSDSQTDSASQRAAGRGVAGGQRHFGGEDLQSPPVVLAPHRRDRCVWSRRTNRNGRVGRAADAAERNDTGGQPVSEEENSIGFRHFFPPPGGIQCHRPAIGLGSRSRECRCSRGEQRGCRPGGYDQWRLSIHAERVANL